MSARLRRAGLCLLGSLAACSADSGPAAQRLPPQQDPRLTWLLEPFPRSDHYDVDTSDPVGILSEVLQHGQRDPLKRARIELAEEGPSGVAAARRLIEATWNDPARFADIRNALDVLSYAATPEAHDLIARVLQHESPSPRQAAWRALRPLAQPSDYERLRELLDLEDAEFSPELAVLLLRADPRRAALEYLDWIESGRYAWLWAEVVRGVAETPGDEIQRRSCGLFAGQELTVQAMLAASCARGADPAALALLREWQQSDKPGARQLALEGFISAGLLDELAWTLERDPDAQLRLRAAQVIGADLAPGRALPLLLAGMNDADESVAAACVAALIQAGNEEAIERAFQDLSADRVGALENAVLSLRELLLEDPALAERAFERVLARAQEESYAGLDQRRPTLRALGLLPCTRAAEYLDELSRSVSGEIQKTSAPRWVLLQIGNAGEPGQRYLIEQLASERDPIRRLDLIESLSAQPTGLAREWLLERAQAEELSPYELLFIADRLTRIGPARRVAPVLKRATLRIDQEDVRRALQGLLWVWYPGPRV